MHSALLSFQGSPTKEFIRSKVYERDGIPPEILAWSRRVVASVVRGHAPFTETRAFEFYKTWKVTESYTDPDTLVNESRVTTYTYPYIGLSDGNAVAGATPIPLVKTVTFQSAGFQTNFTTRQQSPPTVLNPFLRRENRLVRKGPPIGAPPPFAGDFYITIDETVEDGPHGFGHLIEPWLNALHALPPPESIANPTGPQRVKLAFQWFDDNFVLRGITPFIPAIQPAFPGSAVESMEMGWRSANVLGIFNQGGPECFFSITHDSLLAYFTPGATAFYVHLEDHNNHDGSTLKTITRKIRVVNSSTGDYLDPPELSIADANYLRDEPMFANYFVGGFDLEARMIPPQPTYPGVED